jgi:hypothetical protein
MRDELLELGGFSEDYEEPAYYSDNDLCFRARLAGMTLREVRCGLEHLGQVKEGLIDPDVERVLYANQALYRERVLEAVAA